MIFSGWWFQPTHLKNDGVKVSWDGWKFPTERDKNIQHVPNHQPETVVQTVNIGFDDPNLGFDHFSGMYPTRKR